MYNNNQQELDSFSVSIKRNRALCTYTHHCRAKAQTLEGCVGTANAAHTTRR